MTMPNRVIEIGCLLSDPALEKEFRRLKKRDLRETYSLKMACGLFRPQKCIDSVFMMDKLNTDPKSHPQPIHSGPSVRTRPEDKSVELQMIKCSDPGENPAELHDWIRERKALRQALDGMGDLRRWLNNKPIHSDLEALIAEREAKTKMMSTLLEPRIYPTDSGTEGLQDVEMLVIMQSSGVLADSKIQDANSNSSMRGPVGREVDHFRRQCFREYLKSLEHWQQQGLDVNQASLQRVLLYPGDKTLGGKVLIKGCEEQGGGLAAQSMSKTHREGNKEKGVRHKGLKEIRNKKQSTRLSDPNAFWPGREDHVRLFMPEMIRSPAMVLFQRTEHTPGPSPGNWPVNHLGYSTSGDIDAHKVYAL